MLEVDTTELRDSSLEVQQFWLHAIEAAQQAGTRALELTEGATNNWNDIIRDGKFSHLPTTTPITTEEGASQTPSSLPTSTTESTSASAGGTSSLSQLVQSATYSQ